MLLNERRESAIKHLSSFGHHQRVAGFWTYHGLDEQIREHYVFPLDAYDLVRTRAHFVVGGRAGCSERTAASDLCVPETASSDAKFRSSRRQRPPGMTRSPMCPWPNRGVRPPPAKSVPRYGPLRGAEWPAGSAISILLL